MMQADIDRLSKHLEAGACEQALTIQDCLLSSVAVSMKRIADVLTDQNEFGEKGAQAIAGAVWRGLNDIAQTNIPR